jgi:hypothetical protein
VGAKTEAIGAGRRTLSGRLGKAYEGFLSGSPPPDRGGSLLNTGGAARLDLGADNAALDERQPEQLAAIARTLVGDVSACTGRFDESMAAIDITFYVGLQGKEFFLHNHKSSRASAIARTRVPTGSRAAGSVVVAGDEVSQLRN